MPQVAQQDYIYIKPVNANTVLKDAAALGQLQRAIDNGTIWDCLIIDYSINEGVGFVNLGKVLGINKDGTSSVLYLLDADSGQIAGLGLTNTATQYEGLAAIQREFIMDDFEAPGTTQIPSVTVLDDVLFETHNGAFICVGGFLLTATVGEGRLMHLSISTREPSSGDDWVNITWEDAQKLIGLPIINA